MITLFLPELIIDRVDLLVEGKLFPNRSEGLRFMIQVYTDAAFGGPAMDPAKDKENISKIVEAKKENKLIEA
jgi:Arc/MetJ-type ribon-helix-helix transcriptional regulator